MLNSLKPHKREVNWTQFFLVIIKYCVGIENQNRASGLNKKNMSIEIKKNISLELRKFHFSQ